MSAICIPMCPRQRALDKLGLEAAVEARGAGDAANLALAARTISREDTIAMLRDAAAGASGGAHGGQTSLTDGEIDDLIVDAERTAQSQLIDAAAATRHSSIASGRGRGRGRGGASSFSAGRGYGRGRGGGGGASFAFSTGAMGGAAIAAQGGTAASYADGMAPPVKRGPGRPPGSGRGRGRGCGRGGAAAAAATAAAASIAAIAAAYPGGSTAGALAAGTSGGGGFKRHASVYEAIEHGQFVAGKRQVKQRTQMQDGDATFLADLPSEEGAPRAKAAHASRRTFENHHLCQACWDGGDLIMCDYCPVSMCFGCAGVDPVTLGRSWRCGHHSCTGCGRRASAAGGMLFRCAECPRAFCEDCLPREARVINEQARFAALGYATPKSACYVLCSELCTAKAREHTERML